MDKFYQLLDKYSIASKSELSTLEEQIWKEFGCDKFVMVLDISNIESGIQKNGLIHDLAMIRRVRQVAEEMTSKSIKSSQIVKSENDKIFIVFDSLDVAVQFAKDINISLRVTDQFRDDASDASVSIVITQGKILLISENDLFGESVELGKEISENIAQSGEILISNKLDIGLNNVQFTKASYNIAGKQTELFKIEY